MCLHFVEILTGISQTVRSVETNACKRKSFHTVVVVFITVTQIITLCSVQFSVLN